MNVTASLTNAQRAEAFAAEVRSHLGDLPADELDDLLDGLGADLAERLNDGDELGDAAGYAEELRQAAGLPPRDPNGPPRVTLSDRFASARERSAHWFAETPARRGLRDFAVSLRPLWWVLRAVIVAWVALNILNHPLVNGLPVSPLSILFTLGLIVVSVQWGRGRWLPFPWLRVIRTVANIAAIVLLLPFLWSNWANATTPNIDYIYEEANTQGIVSNGDQVTNIFAYDCEGNPLPAVRLYDQQGNPLSTLGPDSLEPPETWNEEGFLTERHGFNPLAKDAEAWNVFPLSAAHLSEETGEEGTMGPAIPPRDYFPPLARDCAAAAEANTADANTAETNAEGADSSDTESPEAGQSSTADEQAAKSEGSGGEPAGGAATGRSNAAAVPASVPASGATEAP